MCLLCSDNPSQIGSVSVAIRIMCENAKAGQVRPRIAEKHTHIQGPNGISFYTKYEILVSHDSGLILHNGGNTLLRQTCSSTLTHSASPELI